MNFRSNKHFLVHFGGVRVAGGEKIAAAVSDTEATNRLVHHHDQPVQPVQNITNRFIRPPTGSSGMEKESEVAPIPGDFQPVHQNHQPVQGATNRLKRDTNRFIG